MTAFVDKDFKIVMNVKWGHRVGVLKLQDHVLLKEKEIPRVHAHTAKAIGGHSKKVAICNEEEKPQEKPKV